MRLLVFSFVFALQLLASANSAKDVGEKRSKRVSNVDNSQKQISSPSKSKLSVKSKKSLAKRQEHSNDDTGTQLNLSKLEAPAAEKAASVDNVENLPKSSRVDDSNVGPKENKEAAEAAEKNSSEKDKKPSRDRSKTSSTKDTHADTAADTAAASASKIRKMLEEHLKKNATQKGKKDIKNLKENAPTLTNTGTTKTTTTTKSETTTMTTATSPVVENLSNFSTTNSSASRRLKKVETDEVNADALEAANQNGAEIDAANQNDGPVAEPVAPKEHGQNSIAQKITEGKKEEKDETQDAKRDAGVVSPVAKQPEKKEEPEIKNAEDANSKPAEGGKTEQATKNEPAAVNGGGGDTAVVNQVEAKPDEKAGKQTDEAAAPQAVPETGDTDAGNTAAKNPAEVKATEESIKGAGKPEPGVRVQEPEKPDGSEGDINIPRPEGVVDDDDAAAKDAGGEVEKKDKTTSLNEGGKMTEKPEVKKDTDTKPESNGDSVRAQESVKSPSVPPPPAIHFENEDTSSHFMTYFVSISILTIIVYVTYHNRKKILGLILEGRGAARARRSRVNYSKLRVEPVADDVASGRTDPVRDFIY